MKSASINKGFIIRKIYPVISSFLEGKYLSEDVAKNFLDSQPKNVKNLLNWESKRYKNNSPSIDPLNRSFMPTTHPDISYTKPSNYKKNLFKTPVFFSCPKCSGRLFWGMPKCGWCGITVSNYVSPNKDMSLYLTFMDYLYPQNSRPTLSSALSTFSSNEIVDEPLNKMEFRQTLKNIKKYIPITAYVKK